MAHVKPQPKCIRKTQNEAALKEQGEKTLARDETQEIRLALYKVFNVNFVEQLDSISTVSLLLGEENEDEEKPSDEDFSIVPSTFCINLTKALKPILGRPRNRTASHVDQLEIDASELLKFAKSTQEAETFLALKPQLSASNTKKANTQNRKTQLPRP